MRDRAVPHTNEYSQFLFLFTSVLLNFRDRMQTGTQNIREKKKKIRTKQQEVIEIVMQFRLLWLGQKICAVLVQHQSTYLLI